MSRKTASRRRIRWWGWLLLSLLCLALLPVVQVAAVRFIDPPVTPLMLVRQAEARLGGKHSNRRLYRWIELAAMSRTFLRCVLVSEDQRFFEHHGFDWTQIEVARREASRTGKPVRGASTITMQCARSLFLWQGRSWIRKGLEAYYTWLMELLLPKRRILELYANVIEMGDGIYGLEAAARFYYGASARSLNRQQAATLAALLPNPRGWNPHQLSPRLAARIDRILDREPGLKIPQIP